MMRASFAVRLAAGLSAGALIGLIWPGIGLSLKPSGAIFSDLLKIPIIPVLFFAMAAGMYRVAKVTAGARRMGIVCVAAIIGLSIIGIALGLEIGMFFQPGAGISGATATQPDAPAPSVDWLAFAAKAIPSNLVAAAINGNTLAVAVAGALFGLALAGIGKAAEGIVAGVEAALQAMFMITRWVVALAPVAVIGVIAALVAQQHLAIIMALVKFVFLVYLGLAVLVLLLCAILRLAGERPVTVIRSVWAPIALGFAVRATMPVMPLHMERLQRAGMPAEVAETALPMAYVFNRAAASLFVAIAVLTIAQIRGQPLDGADLATIAATLFVLSLGAPSLPSGSLLVVSAALVNIGLPAGDVAIVAGIDALTDGPRTSVNILVKTTIVVLVRRFGTVRPASATVQRSVAPIGHDSGLP